MIQRDTDALLTFIFDSIGEIAKLNDNKRLLQALAKMGRDIVFADRCTIWIWDKEKKLLWTKVAHGIEHLSMEPDSGIVGSAIRSGESLVINDVYGDARFNKNIDKQTGYVTKNMMVIPMKNSMEETTGAIQVINKKEGRDFTQEDLNHLKLASTYVSETIRSMFLLEEIEATQQELANIIGIVGENRSQETANHVRRVCEYSYLLASLSGLSEEECKLVYDASPLHDIGKIAIPDAILNKAGIYTKHEREVMNRHAELGYNMLKHSERGLLKAGATIAYEHHEKWDGTGYPRGLKGEEIHIFGRIVALVDVFDALSCDRVYKKGWEHSRVIDYIQEQSGKHFDPSLVDLLFEHEERFLDIKERFQDTFEIPKVELKEETESIQVLGAYGSKSKNGGSTAFLLEKNITIDAGNLIQPLGEKCTDLESIWLTHSHLDHISDIAFVVDNYYERRTSTLKIYALAETIEVLKTCIFNNVVWPDFSNIPLSNAEGMSLSYHPIVHGECYEVKEGLFVEPVKTDHSVPSCGYVVQKAGHVVLITSDTLGLDSVIARLNSDSKITALVVECSFPSSMEALAKESKHLTPKWLFEALQQIDNKALKVYINHIKPEYESEIVEEIRVLQGDWDTHILKDGDDIHF